VPTTAETRGVLFVAQQTFQSRRQKCASLSRTVFLATPSEVPSHFLQGFREAIHRRWSAAEDLSNLVRDRVRFDFGKFLIFGLDSAGRDILPNHEESQVFKQFPHSNGSSTKCRCLFLFLTWSIPPAAYCPGFHSSLFFFLFSAGAREWAISNNSAPMPGDGVGLPVRNPPRAGPHPKLAIHRRRPVGLSSQESARDVA